MQTVKLEEIKNYARQIADEFHAQKIILFGSYAYGNPSANSDVDILVIGNFPGRPVEQAFKIRKKIPRNFPVDLIVRNSNHINKRLRLGDFFLKEIISNGRILYERAG